MSAYSTWPQSRQVKNKPVNQSWLTTLFFKVDCLIYNSWSANAKTVGPPDRLPLSSHIKSSTRFRHALYREGFFRTMNERTFRICIVLLLAIFVGGSLYFASLVAQNGRYTQYDKRREYSPDGKTHMQKPAYQVFDTRTGTIHRP